LIIEKITFKNKFNETLKGVIYKPSHYKSHRGIVICDGFKSIGLDSVKLARALCKRNYIVMRFHYSSNWWSKDKFENLTITKELTEIESAINYFCKHSQVKNIGLLGRSLGASTAFIYAAKHKKVKALVCISILINFEEVIHSYFTDEDLKEGMKRKYMVFKIPVHFPIPIIRFKVKSRALSDLRKYNMGIYAKKIKCPVLFIHGKNDQRSLPADVKKFSKILKSPTKIKFLEKGGHVYLFMRNKEEIHDSAASWFKKYL